MQEPNLEWRGNSQAEPEAGLELWATGFPLLHREHGHSTTPRISHLTGAFDAKQFSEATHGLWMVGAHDPAPSEEEL